MARDKKKIPGVPDGARTFKQQLPVPLGDDEVRKKATKASTVMTRVDKAREEMNEATKVYRLEIKEKTAQARQLMRDIETGTEMRDVACYEVKEHKRGLAVTFRADTGKEVSNRTLAPEEYQEDLLGTGAAGKAAKGAKAGKATKKGAATAAPKADDKNGSAPDPWATDGEEKPNAEA